jgi:hypothetical protein
MTMTFGYDFSDSVEMGDFVTLTPGRYIFKLQKIEKGESGAGNPKAVVQLEVAAGNPAYVGGIISQHWPTTGKGAFRFRAFLKAIGADVSDKGKVNLGKFIGKATFGARVSLSAGDTPNEAGETIYFHELNGILPASQYADLIEEEDDDFDDEEVDDEEEIEEDEDLDEEEDDDDDEVVEEDEDGDEFGPDDLEEMSLAELKEIAEEYEISVKPAKGKTRISKSLMIKRITAELFPDDGEEEADDDDDEEEPF